jgi:CMP-N-acetylneuraminic acid synthetase
MKTIAFIPLRGGSKTIPLKNIKMFCGMPLACRCINAAKHSKLIDKIYIIYDDNIIKTFLSQYGGGKVNFEEVSEMDDKCMQEQPMLAFAKDHEFDAIVLLQATTPYTTAKDLDNGISLYRNGNFDSVVSVSRQHRFLWGQTAENAYPLNYSAKRRPRRQEWGGLLVENGAFFITSREALLNSECRIPGRTGLYEMPAYTYWEIDDETDWLIAEEIFKRRVLNG